MPEKSNILGPYYIKNASEIQYIRTLLHKQCTRIQCYLSCILQSQCVIFEKVQKRNCYKQKSEHNYIEFGWSLVKRVLIWFCLSDKRRTLAGMDNPMEFGNTRGSNKKIKTWPIEQIFSFIYPWRCKYSLECVNMVKCGQQIILSFAWTSQCGLWQMDTHFRCFKYKVPNESNLVCLVQNTLLIKDAKDVLQRSILTHAYGAKNC